MIITDDFLSNVTHCEILAIPVQDGYCTKFVFHTRNAQPSEMKIDWDKTTDPHNQEAHIWSEPQEACGLRSQVIHHIHTKKYA